ncbi:ParB/RepB/Spo0J family partition protein [Thalassobaculum sp. OXR-137]|uniref:ParB/RepB/Spo0J family partition protein n=1 Tax=Thalassobaculum sp. OXR-137 TaxID=3100173 RepID=UPI002AC9BF1C|nr:ParB/RepB/Spo0J family partition protein [Thalassobaculum sp. OXR-137]WPZ35478.1 ParB/RepB/Spo0J family partition protein [Thalassobaculum sp. OXR-137]
MSEETGKRRSNKLGRGLSALLGEDEDEQAQLERLRQSRALPVEQLTPGPFQPRRRFDQEDLRELAESVREQGVIQPILVRRAPDGDKYQIIAGERRWRAAQLAQLHEVPVLIREFDDQTAMEIAIVENVQRRDLTPLEEAEGYRRLIDEYSHSQDDIARAVGKSRSHVANTLRLLNLPDEVRVLVEDGQLTAGHARALLSAEDPAALAREVVTRKLNVRDTERLVQREKAPPPAPAAPKQKDADTRILEQDLSDRTGLVVAINHNANNGSGSVTLRYQDLDQLDLIVERLSAHQNRRSDTFGALDGGPAEAEAADEDGEWDAPLPDEVDLTAGIDPTRPRPTAPDEEGIAEPAGEAADGSDLDGDDPTDTRWDFDDDDEDDDPLIPKT